MTKVLGNLRRQTSKSNKIFFIQNLTFIKKASSERNKNTYPQMQPSARGYNKFLHTSIRERKLTK